MSEPTWTCPFCGSRHDGENPFEAAEEPMAWVADDDRPSPYKLYEETGGGDAYRVAMLENGYVYPSPPWARKTSDKRVIQCGLVHEFNWSEWKTYRENGRAYEGRWCKTCATTQAREVTL